MKRKRSRIAGFTLAELLISLTILAEIATFTIPKIIYAQTNGRLNAVAKEDLATLSAALQQLSLNNKQSASTTAGDLSQYINYVSMDSTSSTIDDAYGFAGSQSCSSGSYCLRLSNGSAIRMNNCNFGGTSTTQNAIEFFIDPDGQITNGGGANTDGKSIRAFLYYNGRIVSWSGVVSGTTTGCQGWGAGTDPPYLKY